MFHEPVPIILHTLLRVSLYRVYRVYREQNYMLHIYFRLNFNHSSLFHRSSCSTNCRPLFNKKRISKSARKKSRSCGEQSFVSPSNQHRFSEVNSPSPPTPSSKRETTSAQRRRRRSTSNRNNRVAN